MGKPKIVAVFPDNDFTIKDIAKTRNLIEKDYPRQEIILTSNKKFLEDPKYISYQIGM